MQEMWNCPYSSVNFSSFAEDFNDRNASSSFVVLSEVARSQGITVVGGSVPEHCGGKLYNTSCVFGADGKLIAKHRKVHLFDINLPGENSFKESYTLTAGDKPTIVDTDIGRIGICHDIRFPELSMLYASRGVHLVCYPGAFNTSTGEALWELVQRARAADNQFGEVIATAGHEETTVIADEVNYYMIQLRRESLPLEKQKRGDIYKVIDYFMD